MRVTSTAPLAALAARRLTNALKTDCRESSNCAFFPSDTIRVIQSYLQSIPSGTTFANEAQVKCYSNICAYLQNVQGSKTIEQSQLFYMTGSINHGCGVCGSDPTEPGTDVSKGQLTLNWVSNPHA